MPTQHFLCRDSVRRVALFATSLALLLTPLAAAHARQYLWCPSSDSDFCQAGHGDFDITIGEDSYCCVVINSSAAPQLEDRVFTTNAFNESSTINVIQGDCLHDLETGPFADFGAAQQANVTFFDSLPENPVSGISVQILSNELGDVELAAQVEDMGDGFWSVIFDPSQFEGEYVYFEATRRSKMQGAVHDTIMLPIAP